MVSTSSQFQTVFTTYREVKEANPGWTDRMVEDYLSLKRDVVTLSDTDDERFEAIEKRLVVIETQLAFSYRKPQRAADELEEIKVEADYTAVKSSLLTCLNLITITVFFNPYPEDGEVLIVAKRTTSKVLWNGNGNNMNGSPSGSIGGRFSSVKFRFSLIAAEWMIL